MFRKTIHIKHYYYKTMSANDSDFLIAFGVEETIYGANVCTKLQGISKWWRRYVTGLHSDTDIIGSGFIWKTRTVAEEKLNYVCKLLETIGNVKHLAHNRINEFILLFSEQQLNDFLKLFNELSKSDKKNYMLQIYLCVFILYPEISKYLNLTDPMYVMAYNTRIIGRMFINNEYVLTKEQITEYISIGKIISYDEDFAKYYIDAPTEEKTKINELSENLFKFRELCRDSCCGRVPSNIESYYQIFIKIPDEKRNKIMEYILKSNYKSIFIIEQMSIYFSTLTFDEMEEHFVRAKTMWPDIYIDDTHRFERLFMDLLKLDYIPTEEDIIKMALLDCESRQDIDLCYWGQCNEEKINKETCQRIGIPYVDYDGEQ